MRPAASISSRPRGKSAPRAAIRPSPMPISQRTASAAVATKPPLMTRSKPMAAPPRRVSAASARPPLLSRHCLKGYSLADPTSWNSDALLEHRAGADDAGDAGRVGRGERAFLALPRHGNFPLEGSARPVRFRAHPHKRPPPRRSQGRRDRLERHLGRLARLRDRARAVPAHSRRDADPGDHIHPGAARSAGVDGGARTRLGDALYRRDSGADHRHLRRGRLLLPRRAPPFRPRQFLLRGDRRGPHREDGPRGRGGEARRRIIFCTNLRGARLVQRLEDELDLPIYDSVALALWKALALAGADPRRVRNWGRLFSVVPRNDAPA